MPEPRSGFGSVPAARTSLARDWRRIADVVAKDDATPGEFRLFLEEICCELCRFRHVREDGLPAERVATVRDTRIGPTDTFADIKVIPADRSPYFVEIKWGYTGEDLIRRLVHKYAADLGEQYRKLIVVTDLADQPGWPAIAEKLRAGLCPSLEVEVWGEAELLRQIKDFLGLTVDRLRGANYQAIRDSIIRAAWTRIFGDTADDRLAPTLLWHFSPWTLQRLHCDLGLPPRGILRPGVHRDVAVLMADLCSFSSYVRDTRDDALVRQALTTFYSQARHAILESGGMLYMFVGDQVIGLFGFPDQRPGDADEAVRCARRLVDIGDSVSERWQRHLDRAQESKGVHIGLAVGDLSLMPLRAFSTAHFAFIGDAINMTARLMEAAAPSEIVLSNGFYRALSTETQYAFQETEPVEGKGVGLIKCWRMPAAG
jgi:class 3 adenylate cyclase